MLFNVQLDVLLRKLLDDTAQQKFPKALQQCYQMENLNIRLAQKK